MVSANKKTSSTVCVAGAGPVGLFTALLLARAGIDTVVFEREPAIVQSPRAMGYFDVVQDEFRKAGILEDVEKESLRNTQGLKWRKPKDGGYLAELPGGPNPNQGPLQLGQHDVAKIILRHLEKYSHVEVNFGHTLKTLEQSEADGTVITRYSVDGKENTRSHTSRFLVGSDGGKSTARQLLGVRLEGFTWEDFQMAAVNIDYDLGAYGWAPGNAVVGDDVWAIVANVAEGTLWRVAYGISSAELDPDESFDEEREQVRCRQKLAKILPGPTHQAEIKMLSLYQPRQMCATTFVQGRVALAGDSAHLTCPIGGLGLTTGLLDAALLGRVLKKIILDSEPLSLLESYGETRRNVFQNVTNPAATFHTRLLAGKDEESRAMREEFLEKVNSRDMAYLMKLGETYHKITSTRDE